MAKCVISGVAPGGGGVKIVTGRFENEIIVLETLPKLIIVTGIGTEGSRIVNVVAFILPQNQAGFSLSENQGAFRFMSVGVSGNSISIYIPYVANVVGDFFAFF